MSKSHICYDKTCKCEHESEKEREYQNKEYVPNGPVNIKPSMKPSFMKLESNAKYGKQSEPKRVGWLYDAHTGLSLGPASDEMKAEHKSGEVWERIIAGMKQKVVIG